MKIISAKKKDGTELTMELLKIEKDIDAIFVKYDLKQLKVDYTEGYVCPYDGMVFVSEKALEKHIEFKHKKKETG